MLKIIKAAIIFAALACAPAFADSFDQRALIAKAVDTTITNFKAGGIQRVAEASQNCYRGLDVSPRNKNRERDAQFCIAQDNAGLKLYSITTPQDQRSLQDYFGDMEPFFLTWINVADAVARLTPEMYKFYLGPLMTDTYSVMTAKFK